ncbi:hypothetical protein HPB47_010746 [Ixodes persulcatus]|uniref:Uncharacterized protein n=1 Tax=Ixodes persulcatus TaxID=34615 RepID=A0AC60NYE6_IXOPE|nr:hypothetical protein HPB47_010746 [Ixodes persulcatus]
MRAETSTLDPALRGTLPRRRTARPGHVGIYMNPLESKRADQRAFEGAARRSYSRRHLVVIDSAVSPINRRTVTYPEEVHQRPVGLPRRSGSFDTGARLAEREKRSPRLLPRQRLDSERTQRSVRFVTGLKAVRENEWLVTPVTIGDARGTDASLR